MGITLEELKSKEMLYRANTKGGGTYIVDGKPLCLSYMQPWNDFDGYCTHPAGWGTDHFNLGRCKQHCGLDKDQRYALGRYTKWTKARLQDDYEAFVTDPELMNLSPELAILRTILRETIATYEATGDMKSLAFANTVLDNVGRMVERMEKIQSDHVLTAATARYLIAKGLEVARRYVPEGQMYVFVAAWKDEVQAALTGKPEVLEQRALQLGTANIDIGGNGRNGNGDEY